MRSGQTTLSAHPRTSHVIAGRYQVAGRLGEGAGGEVVRVRDLRRGGAEYALKFLGNGDAFGIGTLDRFLCEHRVLTALRHPHIIRAYELITVGRKLGYVMELVEAQDLAEILSRRRLSASEVSTIFSQLLSAVETLHDNGVLHRDLKLENVLFSKETGVKLADFGLVKVPQSDAMTQSGILLGTAQYFPPEYIKEHRYDERSEIYTLGLLLYEVLARKRWLSGMDGKKAMRHMIEHKFSVPFTLPEGTPELFRRVIEKAIDPDPERRYQSAREMAEALTSPAQWTGLSRRAGTPFIDQPHLAKEGLLKRLSGHVRRGFWFRWLQSAW